MGQDVQGFRRARRVSRTRRIIGPRRHNQFTIEEYFLLLTRYSAWMFCAGAMFLAGAASSQNYPNKPIRLVTVEAGGSADFAARIIAVALSGSLGQHVIVDNRGGASGLIAI